AVSDPFADQGLRDTRNLIQLPNLIQVGEWMHIAAVSGKQGMRLYANGILVGTNVYTGSFASLKPAFWKNYLGRSNWKVEASYGDTDFQGQIDEVRVWKVARSEEQIRENIFKELTGKEPGLVACWNFDDPANPGRDLSPGGHHGKLIGNAKALPASRTGAATATQFTLVLDLDGKDSCVELPPNFINELTEATVEGWIKWRRFGGDSRLFDFGKAWQSMNLNQLQNSGTMRFEL